MTCGIEQNWLFCLICWNWVIIIICPKRNHTRDSSSIFPFFMQSKMIWTNTEKFKLTRHCVKQMPSTFFARATLFHINSHPRHWYSLWSWASIQTTDKQDEYLTRECNGWITTHDSYYFLVFHLWDISLQSANPIVRGVQLVIEIRSQ